MAHRSVACWVLGVAVFAGGLANAAETGNDPLALFEQRIMPIFKSSQPSSCVQCHLASVDLKDYILPSHEATFASLNQQGMVDLEKPEESKILKLIAMGDRDQDAKAKRIHEKMRRAEYDAFAAWIKACCNDPQLRKLKAGEVAKPAHADEVIRHARKSRIVDSFVRKIWSQRMRCFPCHTPHELDPDNPKHQVAIKRVVELKRKYGAEYAERLDIFRETPEATLQYLVADSRNTPDDRLPLLNLADAQRSLLLLKPTAKLPPKIGKKEFAAPTYLEPISHMGGLKIHVDDPGYKSFVSWIRDYANVVQGKYVDVSSLPSDNWRPSKQFLMVFDAPDAWNPQTTVQMTVHPWDAEREGRSPVAFTQNRTTPRGRIVAPLVLLGGAANDSHFQTNAAGELKLKAGKYVIKVFLDRNKRLKTDPTAMLGGDDFFGEFVIEAEWREGFPGREMISAEKLTSASSSE